jgi:hypothetical protein
LLILFHGIQHYPNSGKVANFVISDTVIENGISRLNFLICGQNQAPVRPQLGPKGAYCINPSECVPNIAAIGSQQVSSGISIMATRKISRGGRIVY